VTLSECNVATPPTSSAARFNSRISGRLIPLVEDYLRDYLSSLWPDVTMCCLCQNLLLAFDYWI
jgi:hypothetical protein